MAGGCSSNLLMWQFEAAFSGLKKWDHVAPTMLKENLQARLHSSEQVRFGLARPFERLLRRLQAVRAE